MEQSDFEELSREGELQREKYYDIGFRKGLLESQSLSAQEGFDAGYSVGFRVSFIGAMSDQQRTENPQDLWSRNKKSFSQRGFLEKYVEDLDVKIRQQTKSQ